MGKNVGANIMLVLLLIVFLSPQNSAQTIQNNYFAQFSENDTFVFQSTVDPVHEYGFVIPTGDGFYFVPDDYLKQPYFYEFDTGNTSLIGKTTGSTFRYFPLLLENGSLLFLERISQQSEQIIRIINQDSSIVFEGEFNIANIIGSMRVYVEPSNAAIYLQLYDKLDQFFGLIYFNVDQNGVQGNSIEFNPTLGFDFIGRFFHYNNELYYYHSTSDTNVNQISKLINGTLHEVLNVQVIPEYNEYSWVQDIIVISDKLVINTVTVSRGWLFSIDSINLINITEDKLMNTTMQNHFSTIVNHSPCTKSINGRCEYYSNPIQHNGSYFWTLPSSVVYTEDFGNFTHNKIAFDIPANKIPVGTIWNSTGHPGFVTFNYGKQISLPTTSSIHYDTTSSDSESSGSTQTISSTKSPSELSTSSPTLSLSFSTKSIFGIFIIPIVKSLRKCRKSN